ncbi:MAG: ABC transporter ATP-binding protein [Acetobacteraceae bacterium]
MAEPALELSRLAKTFGEVRAVDSIDLIVAQGEFVTLLGPSGCGKSTTLGMIAGFQTPDEGSIRLMGRAVERLAPFRRDVGLVFQDLALFPHMSVAANVAFGLRMRRIGKPEIAKRVAAALEMVRLRGLDERRPGQLSGGQRQRVALARALVIRPAMLLLDEPLSSLDLKLREELRSEIAQLQRHLGIATVFVTHDQTEALTMSDRVAVMRSGRIEQIGLPAEIYERPASRFVAEFIGSTNVVRGRLATAPDGDGIASIRTGAGMAAARVPAGTGPDVLLTIRPERLRFAANGRAPDGVSTWAADVDHTVYSGNRIEIWLRLADGSSAVMETVNAGTPPPAPGASVSVWFGVDDAWVIVDREESLRAT